MSEREIVVVIKQHESGESPQRTSTENRQYIRRLFIEFGFNSATLAKEYGDKGTVSKVLNSKQSLSMILKFCQLLSIPA